MIKKQLHEHLIKKSDELCSWYSDKISKLSVPIYSSYDIRESLHKISAVDANIYPAGFNNICPADKEISVGLFNEYLLEHYEKKINRILLITEEHTQNPYYWDNVYCIQNLIQNTGRSVQVAVPKKIEKPLVLTSASGRTIEVQSGYGDESWLKEFNPDLVISNNDFSQPLKEWSETLDLPINPPRELGWHQRKKSLYFENYNQLATEFSELIGENPYHFRVETELFDQFDINSEESRAELAHQVELMLQKLKKTYTENGIDQEPFVFIKNNSGTYGLGVVVVKSSEDVKNWTYKARKKMKAAKGGRDIEQVIIQEGIPTVVKSEESIAEPVIYMIGKNLAGGFLRTHGEKSDSENLNAPGAVYKRLCVSDLMTDANRCILENVYGWIAKLGVLAIGLESEDMNVQYRDYLFSKGCQITSKP
ncbi:MAG TPA: glutamate--cysteine ligase [Pseudobdellovibrionaceae bacterium]|nr:glutamate--cysteine ligase [Pseudobdellovibrionaceae bacterium]